MKGKKAIAALGRFYPPCGPCMFCGGPDKRHRLWDALMGCAENDQDTATEYSVTVEHVRAVRQVRPYRRGGRPMEAA